MRFDIGTLDSGEWSLPFGLLVYTPGIYADGYIVFVFLYICPFVYSSVRSSNTLTKITSKFWVKVSQIRISQQPLIRKRSYLGHGYLRGSGYIP